MSLPAEKKAATPLLMWNNISENYPFLFGKG
jgi:hypothetical protein